MLEQILVNILSAVLAAAIIAVLGFLNGRKIRRLLVGTDLLTADNVPAIGIEDRQCITDFRYNEGVAFIIWNCGPVNLKGVALYRCVQENAGNPTSLVVQRMPFTRQFRSVSMNDGESMQIELDPKYFAEDDWYPDHRMFIEMASEDGSLFRATVTRIPSHGFCIAHIGRVRKSLPRRMLKTKSQSKIERMVRKYDLDLAVG